MDATAATTESPIVVSWDDITTTSFTPGASQTITTGATFVDAVAVPGGSTQRAVKYLSCRNDDSTSRICTFRYNDNGTTRNLASSTLQPGDALVYANGTWQVISKLGVTSIPAVGAQGQIIESSGSALRWANLISDYQTKSASYSVLATDQRVFFDVTVGSSADVTMTLPNSSSALKGALFLFRKIDAGTKHLLITPGGSDGIDGTAAGFGTYLIQQYARILVMCTGQTGVNAWTVLDVCDWITSGNQGPTNLASAGSFENIASVIIPAGEWTLDGQLIIGLGSLSAGTVTNANRIAIATSNVSGGAFAGDDEMDSGYPPTATNGPVPLNINGYRKVVTSTTTMFLNSLTLVSGKTGSYTGQGRLTARRAR